MFSERVVFYWKLTCLLFMLFKVIVYIIVFHELIMNTETVLHVLWLPYSQYLTLSVWPSCSG